MFLLPPVGLALLLFHRRAIHKVVLPGLAVALPWYLFATLYYGSPVPNTIVAKSWSYQIGFFSASWEEIWNFTLRSWRDYAPFKEFWLAYEAPLPDIGLKASLLPWCCLSCRSGPGRDAPAAHPDRAVTVLGFVWPTEFDYQEFVLHVVPAAVQPPCFLCAGYACPNWRPRQSGRAIVLG